jgi:hypothetical protein
MNLLHTVRRTLTGEVMPLHHTSKTTTLTGARNINCLHFRQDINLDFLTQLISVRTTAKLTDKLLGLTARLRRNLDTCSGPRLRPLTTDFRNVTTLTLAGQSPGLIKIPQLDGFIAITILGPQLRYMTRAGCNDRHRNCLTLLVVDLCHPDLPAEYPFTHN